MSAIKIIDNVYWVGARDPQLHIFDIIMTAEQGTSYKCLFSKGSRKDCLD